VSFATELSTTCCIVQLHTWLLFNYFVYSLGQVCQNKSYGIVSGSSFTGLNPPVALADVQLAVKGT